MTKLDRIRKLTLTERIFRAPELETIEERIAVLQYTTAPTPAVKDLLLDENPRAAELDPHAFFLAVHAVENSWEALDKEARAAIIAIHR